MKWGCCSSWQRERPTSFLSVCTQASAMCSQRQTAIVVNAVDNPLENGSHESLPAPASVLWDLLAALRHAVRTAARRSNGSPRV
eukprot:365301-Chlamydomonas_euryale.AAC.4